MWFYVEGNLEFTQDGKIVKHRLWVSAKIGIEASEHMRRHWVGGWGIMARLAQ